MALHGKNSKTIRRSTYNYPEIYYMYAFILIETRDYDLAEINLLKALKWNPVSSILLANGIYKLLEQARNEFELVPSKGSEPDLIIIGEDNLIFIEAKLTAKNETSPTNQNVEKKYVSGGTNWWKAVFASDFNEVANTAKKYELARFWLLGTWMAQKLGVGF